MGGRDLGQLLATMSPELRPTRFVFATLPDGRLPDAVVAVASVREDEGLSVVVDAEQAREHGIDGEFPCAWITLRVHSALDAVGFLAVVTSALAEAGISANAVAGSHHDHLFVPWSRRDAAMAVLDGLTRA